MKICAKKQDIIKYCVAITVVCCAVFFGIYFYKNADRVEPKNPISQEIEQLTQNGETQIGESLAQQLENSQTDNSQTDNEGENDKNDSGKSNENSENSNENFGTSNINNQPQNNENGNLSGGKNQQNDSQSDEKKQSGGINADIKPEGESDIVYFKTSIKDGETVSEKLYQFTITQLQKDLKLRSTKVSVNGEEIAQFSGKCTLDEGKNIIRVQCTYTQNDNTIKRAYKDYTVYCYSENIGFSTDLTDKEVNEEQLNFYATAFYDKDEISVKVMLNGNEISGNGKYSVNLSENENYITLFAEYKGKKAEKNYTIKYVKPQEFGISTNLYDQTTSAESFSFYAKMLGNSENAKMTVAVNGKSVSGADGNYNVTLKTGGNSIRIKAKDGEKSAEKVFTITYIPTADETTKPVISQINLTDEMTVRGSGFSMSLTAADCNSERIYADKIEVYVNGIYVDYDWQNSTDTGYYLPLNAGENTVEIKITDSQGRYQNYFYTINCQRVQQGEEVGKIQFQFDANVMGIPSFVQNSQVSFYEGESAMDCIKRYLEENGFSCEISGDADTGYYLKRISKESAFVGTQIPAQLDSYLSQDGIGKTGISSADSLGELDFTQGSGWIISLNGKVTSYGISQVHFADGDVLRLTFTLCYGREISGAENAYDVVW